MNKQAFFAPAIILIAILFSSNNLSAQWGQSNTAIYETTLSKNVLIGTSTSTNGRLQFDNSNGNKITLYDNGNNSAYGFGINPNNLCAYIPGTTGYRFSVRADNYNGAEKFSVTSDGDAFVNRTLFVGNNSNNGSVDIGFAGAAGEGIGSKRTAGGNQYGLDLFTGFKSRLSITNGGNVGIGTTAPTSNFHVNVPASTNPISAMSIDVQSFGNMANAKASCYFRVRDIGAGGAPLFYIQGDGNVGIGNTNPAYKLTVQTATNSYGIVHSDGNIKLATYVGGAGNGGYLGTQSNHALHFFTNGGGAQMSLQTSGKVGIGISDPSSMPGTYKLYVADGILTEKVKVALKNTANWADYVFASDYKLRSLTEVEQYVQENKHLPGVPSAEEVQKTGIDMATMDAKLLEKIEELTLYIIDMKKENEALKARLNTLESKK